MHILIYPSTLYISKRVKVKNGGKRYRKREKKEEN
jgi:hypothetical protein